MIPFQLKKSLLSVVGAALILVSSLTMPLQAAALSDAMEQFYNDNDIRFYDPDAGLNSCDPDGGMTNVSPGSGAPNGLTYPDLDSTKMVDAIEAFIEKNAKNSPLAGTASKAVPSGKEANINPFLFYAHAHMESNLGTTTIPGAQIKIHQGHNTIGRTATKAQPHVMEANRPWYKWSSFASSVDSSDPENSGGGDWFSYARRRFPAEIDAGLSKYSTIYAPPSENDTQAYIKTMQAALDEMANSAGGSGGGSSSSGSVSSSMDECCADPSSGGSTVPGGDTHVDQALGYLMKENKLTLEQASGIIGNLQVESGDKLDPNASAGGVYRGIVQWDSGRWNTLGQFAKAVGGKQTDFDIQLRFMAWELTLNNEWSGRTGSEGGALTKLKATKSTKDAAASFYKYYERASAGLSQRISKAEAIYKKYVDKAPKASLEDEPGTAATCSPSGSGDVSSLQELTLKYAWPDWKGRGYVKKMPEYHKAIEEAKSDGRYVGNNGVDCGGFTTTLIHNSGWDTGFNYGSKVSDGAGPTPSQNAWMKANWELLGDGSIEASTLQPGDVAWYPGHTWIYVGEIEGFAHTHASASNGERSPMASETGTTGGKSPSVVRWYRKKG